jgi:glycosyltransferase involved in cell wall biosynthesis
MTAGYGDEGMRILVLTNMYPPHAIGGYEMVCDDVMRRFRERGHDVKVLTTTMRLDDVADGDDDAAGNVRRELTFYWHDHRLVSPSPLVRLRIERRNQARLASALRAWQPDVVSVWNMGAMSLGLLTTVAEQQIPMLLNVHDDWLVYGPELDAWSRIFARRPRLARAMRVLAGMPTSFSDLGDAAVACFNSDFTRRRAFAEGAWRPPEMSVVFPGIDTRHFPLAEAGAGPGAPPPWTGRVLYVGRVDERKGMETLVRAVSRLPPDVSLDFVGRGDTDYRRHLEAVVHQLGLAGRVHFDAVPRAELRSRYAAADVLVFPSEWDEPFGLVPLEAMACMTPVVATGTGGSGEFLADGVNCLLYQAGNAEELAAAISRLAGDPTLRRTLVTGGLATAAELTADRYADVLLGRHESAARRSTVLGGAR